MVYMLLLRKEELVSAGSAACWLFLLSMWIVLIILSFYSLYFGKLTTFNLTF